jgi:hypothetical protein
VSLLVYIFVPHHPPPLFLHTFAGHQRGTTLGEGDLLLWFEHWRAIIYHSKKKEKKLSYFRHSAKGTLWLDNIAEISLSEQLYCTYFEVNSKQRVIFIQCSQRVLYVHTHRVLSVLTFINATYTSPQALCKFIFFLIIMDFLFVPFPLS